jgi:hypothetical protein
MRISVVLLVGIACAIGTSFAGSSNVSYMQATVIHTNRALVLVLVLVLVLSLYV